MDGLRAFIEVTSFSTRDGTVDVFIMVDLTDYTRRLSGKIKGEKVRLKVSNVMTWIYWIALDGLWASFA